MKKLHNCKNMKVIKENLTFERSIAYVRMTMNQSECSQDDVIVYHVRHLTRSGNKCVCGSQEETALYDDLVSGDEEGYRTLEEAEMACAIEGWPEPLIVDDTGRNRHFTEYFYATVIAWMGTHFPEALEERTKPDASVD